MTIGMAATPASAALVLSPNAGACELGDINPAALQCAGYYDGNLINGSRLDDQAAALALLGLTWDKTTYNDTLFKLSPLEGANANFSQLVTSISYIGIHWGDAVTPTRSRRAGPRRSTGSTPARGSDIIDLVRGASANAYLYSVTPPPPCTGPSCGGGGVPEPATWAMMILGFGGVGAIIRQRRYACWPRA